MISFLRYILFIVSVFPLTYLCAATNTLPSTCNLSSNSLYAGYSSDVLNNQSCTLSPFSVVPTIDTVFGTNTPSLAIAFDPTQSTDLNIVYPMNDLGLPLSGSINTLTNRSVANMLLADNKNSPIVMQNLGNLPDPTILASASPSTSSSPLHHYSAENLLSSNVISDQQGALNFIQFAAGNVQPLPVVTAHPQSFQQNVANADYLSALYSYVAAHSVGLNNLYYLYEERIPKKASTSNQPLSVVATSPPSPTTINNASSVQIEKAEAMRRLIDKNWRTSIMNTNTQALMREQLYLSSEMYYEMYLMRMDLERLLATLSVLQLQQNNAQQKVNVQLSARKLLQLTPE